MTNQLVTILDMVGKEYFVRFHVRLMSSTLGSILRFTLGGDYGDAGPTIYFNDGIVRNFRVYSYINQSKTIFSTASYPLNTWIRIEVKQILEGGQYKRIIIVNNEVLSSVINQHPVEKRNVKVYAGEPRFKAANGYIRNLIFSNSPRKGKAFLYCYKTLSR